MCVTGLFATFCIVCLAFGICTIEVTWRLLTACAWGGILITTLIMCTVSTPFSGLYIASTLLRRRFVRPWRVLDFFNAVIVCAQSAVLISMHHSNDACLSRMTRNAHTTVAAATGIAAGAIVVRIASYVRQCTNGSKPLIPVP